MQFLLVFLAPLYEEIICKGWDVAGVSHRHQESFGVLFPIESRNLKNNLRKASSVTEHFL